MKCFDPCTVRPVLAKSFEELQIPWMKLVGGVVGDPSTSLLQFHNRGAESEVSTPVVRLA